MMLHPANASFYCSGLFGSLVKSRAVFDPATMAIAATVASTVMSAAGSIMSGNAANKAAKFEAAQMTQQAGQERATSQRQAIEQRRQAGLASSKITANAAASGAGATDTTVLNLQGDTAATGEYNALSALYTGEEKARGMEMGATAKRYEGANAAQAGKMQAAGTILSSGKSMYDIYGQGGPSKNVTPSMFPWQQPGNVRPDYMGGGYY